LTLIILDRKEQTLYTDYKVTTQRTDGYVSANVSKMYNLACSAICFAFAGRTKYYDEFLYDIRNENIQDIREFRQYVKSFFTKHKYSLNNANFNLLGFCRETSFQINSPDLAVLSDIPYDDSEKMSRFRSIGLSQTCVVGALNYLSSIDIEPDMSSIYNYISEIDSSVSKQFQVYRQVKQGELPKIFDFIPENLEVLTV
jgi:hypothetical protein